MGLWIQEGGISSRGGLELCTVKSEWPREFPDFLFLCLLCFHPRLVLIHGSWKPWVREPGTWRTGQVNPAAYSPGCFPSTVSELGPSSWQRQKGESIGEFSNNHPQDLRVTFFFPEKIPESQRESWRGLAEQSSLSKTLCYSRLYSSHDPRQS